MCVAIGHEQLWYKVRHPNFDEGLAYLTFALPTGHTFTVQVWRCTKLPLNPVANSLDTSRALDKTEAAFPWARKPVHPNPDLETDL